MINFLNDSVRLEFHKLPIDRQREIQEICGNLQEATGKTYTVLFVDIVDDKTSEISIRIDG